MRNSIDPTDTKEEPMIGIPTQDNIQNKNIENNTPHTFFHEGIVFNPKKNELSFSKEAREALQEVIDEVNMRYAPTDTPDSQNETASQDNISTALDAMIVTGKGEKVVQKFINRVFILLNPKKKSSKEIANIEKKVEKKIEKYTDSPKTNSPVIELFIQYPDGDTRRTLDSVPMKIWLGQDLKSMIESINKRLMYKNVIDSKKDTKKL